MAKTGLSKEQEARSRRFKILRILAGYTQTTLAHEVGVKQGSLSSWESGMIPRDTAMLERLCQIFQVSEGFYHYGRPVVFKGVVWRPVVPERPQHVASVRKEIKEIFPELAMSSGNTHLNFVWQFENGAAYWLGEDDATVSNLLVVKNEYTDIFESVYTSGGPFKIHQSIKFKTMKKPTTADHLFCFKQCIEDFTPAFLYDNIKVNNVFGGTGIELKSDIFDAMHNKLGPVSIDTNQLRKFVKECFDIYSECTNRESRKFSPDGKYFITELFINSYNKIVSYKGENIDIAELEKQYFNMVNSKQDFF